MRIKNILVIVALLCLTACGKKVENGAITQEVPVKTGAMHNSISVTGSVLPRNRLEIKPPVSGRIDSILVKEGQMVKKGAVVAWMSSTERAALLDAAQGQSEQERGHLENAYRPIALITPIDGQVIVSAMQPGQSVAVSDAVIVLSDILIVRAIVDETDIAKLSVGQDASVVIDAYPDSRINAKVEHIYYESETVNNVTTYKVDLSVESVPEFFKSGMNATIDLIADKKDSVLLLPAAAVFHEGKESYVLLKDQTATMRQRVVTGISDDKNIEIVSGLRDGDIVIITIKKYDLPKKDNGSNPFMPKRPGSQKSKNSH